MATDEERNVIDTMRKAIEALGTPRISSAACATLTCFCLVRGFAATVRRVTSVASLLTLIKSYLPRGSSSRSSLVLALSTSPLM